MRAFSAPGKALFAGGYLVLERQYDSLVIALSSRMHSVVDSTVKDQDFTEINVSSPQFNGEWKFKYDNGILSNLGAENPFIAATISNVLAYIKPSTNRTISISIFSDSGYHSQQNVTTRTSGAKSFNYHPSPIEKVAKTGLGSSAGLVTVITSSLLSVYLPIDVESSKDLNIIHNLAQLSHCQAQGKVGSGFDVAAATFGSIVYRRFDPSLINNLSADRDDLVNLINSNWNIKNERVVLPKGIKLLMGDIKTGSNTPKLVSKVLKWKKEDPESEEIYSKLNDSNMKIVESLKQINELPDYSKAQEFITTHTSADVLYSTEEYLSLFRTLINSILTIRENFRIITERSGADIEPPEQTKLLDSCLEMKGVIGGVVPGAGGYDAISLLVSEDSIEGFLKESKTKPEFNDVNWLDLGEEELGLKEENKVDYIGFL